MPWLPTFPCTPPLVQQAPMDMWIVCHPRVCPRCLSALSPQFQPDAIAANAIAAATHFFSPSLHPSPSPPATHYPLPPMSSKFSASKYMSSLPTAPSLCSQQPATTSTSMSCQPGSQTPLPPHSPSDTIPSHSMTDLIEDTSEPKAALVCQEKGSV